MPRKTEPDWGWSPYDYIDKEVEIRDQQDLDIREIYKILGLGDGAHLGEQDDPIFEISRALTTYESVAYASGDPTTFAGRHAVLKELQRHSRALADAFDKMGEGNFQDVDHGIALALGEELSYEMIHEEPMPRELDFFRHYMTDYVDKIADILDLAAKAFPNHPDAPPKGRPIKAPLVGLIQDLAWIYERHTQTDAYKGFTYDAASKEYDGGFFRFAAAVIWKFDPNVAKSNNALGSQIRLALTDKMLARNAMEIQVHYEDEPEMRPERDETRDREPPADD